MADSAHNVTDASFNKAVLASNVPVLVDFWAAWCAPCRMIGSLVAETADTYTGKLKVAKVDVDGNPAAASRYQVRGIPRLMLFKDGVPVATHVGALGEAQFAALVEPHLPH
jgi:thioredoxin 1